MQNGRRARTSVLERVYLRLSPPAAPALRRWRRVRKVVTTAGGTTERTTTQ
jgi:hypothetical protein